MDNSLTAKIKPEWQEINKLREKCIRFLGAHGFAKDLVHSLTMILSELAENSIKYGNFDDANTNIEVSLEIGKEFITVEVNNPVDPKSATHLQRLDKTIQWIRGYQDSFQAYIERLKEISRKPLDDEESGLGLARIAYEGKAILDFFVMENTLNVSAISKYH